MKNLMKRIRMKQRASKIRSKSVDPLKAHRGHVEIGIYTWLLNLIAKELEDEALDNKPVKPVKPVKPSKATATETRTQTEVQVA